MAAKLLAFLLASSLMAAAAGAHNITAILAGFPEYSVYNGYLSQTKVADEINSRETLTCLVLPNPAMSALAAKRPLSAVKNALRLLTLLDYFDTQKLHSISDGTVLTTTLLQTTGSVTGNMGFVNITDLKGGKVGFASAAPGSKFDSVYTKSVKQIPYSISVLEISAPVVFPGLLDAPARVSANLTALLEKAGCKTFASLIVSTGVLKIYQSAMERGALTVFAPNDEAFKAEGVPDLRRLSNAELVTLLQYHAVPAYVPKASLMAAAKGGPIGTLATSGAGQYALSVTARGDDVTLHTGLDSSRVASTVIDDTPFCVLTVDNLLLPSELFGKAPAPAPGPASVASTPTPAAGEAPTPAPAKAKSPESSALSPPAPPTESPSGSPADAPEAKAADSNTEQGAAAKAPPFWGLILAAAAVGSSSLLS